MRPPVFVVYRQSRHSVLSAVLLGLATVVPSATMPSRSSAADPAVPPRLDLYGDPLPDDAISRLGTIRWRADRPIDKMAFSPDGSLLACICARRNLRNQAHQYQILVLDARTGRPIRRLTSPLGPVWAIDFSPQGRQLVAGHGKFMAGGQLLAGDDYGVCLWDVNQGTTRWKQKWEARLSPEVFDTDPAEANRPNRPLFYISCPQYVKFLPDGSGILVSDRLRAHRILNAATGEITAEGLYYLGDQATALANHGRTLLSAQGRQTIQFWDTMTGGEQKTLQVALPEAYFTQEALPVNSRKSLKHLLKNIWVTPDQKTLFLQTSCELVSVDAASGKILKMIIKQPERLAVLKGTAAFSPDSRFAAVRLNRDVHTAELSLLDVRKGEAIRKFTSDQSLSACLQFFPDGKRLAVALDRCIRVWDFQRQEEPPSGPGHWEEIVTVVFSPDGSKVATAGLDGTARLWETRTGKQLHQWFTQPGKYAACAIAFSPDGKALAIDAGDKVQLVNCADGKIIRSLKAYSRRFKKNRHSQSNHLAFFPDGKRLAWWYPEKKRVFVCDVETGELLHDSPVEISAEDRPVSSRPKTRYFPAFSFSPSRRLLAVTDFVCKVYYVFDTSTGKRRLKLDAPNGFTSACFTRDEKQLIVGLQDGTIEVVDLADDKVLRTLRGPDFPEGGHFYETRFGRLEPCGDSFPRSFLDGGRVLVSDHVDNTTRFWDVTTGKQIGQLRGHRIRAVSPDGNHAVSVSPNGTVVVWDLARLRARSGNR